MKAKDLIAELQKLPADIEVCAYDPKGIQSPWLLLRDCQHDGFHIIHIEGMSEQPRKYYIVQCWNQPTGKSKKKKRRSSHGWSR